MIEETLAKTIRKELERREWADRLGRDTMKLERTLAKLCAAELVRKGVKEPQREAP